MRNFLTCLISSAYRLRGIPLPYLYLLNPTYSWVGTIFCSWENPSALNCNSCSYTFNQSNYNVLLHSPDHYYNCLSLGADY